MLDRVVSWSQMNSLNFTKPRNWIRCTAHSINLAAESMSDCIILVFINEVDRVISKIHHNVTKIRNSVLLTTRLANLVQIWDAHCKLTRIIPSVPTRWNSKFFMLSRYIFLKEPLRQLVQLHRETNDLKKISKANWGHILIINRVLFQFYKEYIVLETSTKATMNLVTTAYISIFRHCGFIHEEIKDNKDNDFMCDSLILAQKKICKYFDKGSIMAYGSLLFDPRTKMNSYKAMNWDQYARNMNEE